MKVITSVTMHQTNEGQRISFTYSVVDENSAAVLSENNRGSYIIMDIPANAGLLENIAAVKAYVNEKLGAQT